MSYIRIFSRPELKERRRELRYYMTPAERMFWNYTRSNQLGYRVRRQHSIGEYIVDFYIPTTKLVIELDGNIHNDIKQKEKDSLRTSFFEDLGLRVVRFKNEEVLKQINNVIDTIRSFE